VQRSTTCCLETPRALATKNTTDSIPAASTPGTWAAAQGFPGGWLRPSLGGMSPSHLDPDAGEPDITDLEALRLHRRRRLALAYRVFGALRWGSLGDGHISARDPDRTDHFWVARYGVPFSAMTVDDLVLVGPTGSIAEGAGYINVAAYNIHGPLHEARTDVVSAAHTHTPYGTPFCALVEPLRPICQEACAFVDDHAVFDDEEVNIVSTEGGKRIAQALGRHRAVLLRNHGTLTVGGSVDEAVGWFAMLERVCEVHVKTPQARPISDQAARVAKESVGTVVAGWQAFQWLLRQHVPDPTVVG
jgi:ribulose-5-phosphate 4-epimerase/fuculose-1-phosphate aldolase